MRIAAVVVVERRGHRRRRRDRLEALAHRGTEDGRRRRRPSTSFREASQGSAPVDGVYVYDTKGSESVDVLGGDSHTYPAVTALTVMTEGCGLRMTWKPLAGRAESWLVCPAGGGLDVPRTSSVHSFFRQTYDTAFVCQGSWWVPPPGTTTWTSSCANTDRTATRTGQRHRDRAVHDRR